MRSLVLLIAVASLGACTHPPSAPNVNGIMVLGVQKGGFEGWFSPPVPTDGRVDVLGPFNAAEAARQLNVVCCGHREVSHLRTERVDNYGRFSIALAPAHYVLVGHPSHESQFASGGLTQRHVVVVPAQGVIKVRLLLVAYYP